VRAIFRVSTVFVVLAVLVAASPARAATQTAVARVFDINGRAIVLGQGSNGLSVQGWRAPGTGMYTISFGGMFVPGLPHNIQVSMPEQGVSRSVIVCAPTSEGALNDDLLVTLQCYTDEGQPAWLESETLTIVYRMDDSPTSEVAGYAWNSGNTLVSSWSSRGGTNTLSHVSVGHYVFTFGGLSPAGTGGTVMVSTRTPNTRCAVAGWGGALTVKVVCTAASTSLANFRDANVSVYVGDRAMVTNGNWGFAWANQPTSTVIYVPPLFYQGMSNGGTVNVTRYRTGVYDVEFPGLGGVDGDPANAITVTNGNSDTTCSSSWLGVPDRFSVQCRQNGAFVDSPFLIEAFWR
jgi:hypothetical protein